LRSPRCALINELILGAGAQGVGVGAPTTPATVTTEVFYQGQPAPQVISAPVTPQPFPLPAYAVFQPAGTLSSSAPIDHITVTLSPLASGVWDIDLIDIMTWSAGNGTCLVDQSGSPLIDASSGTLTFVPGSGCP
jgi:hypothetical protein